MSKYLIEDVKCGMQDSGMACGPVGGVIVTEAKVRVGEDVLYYSLAEVTGIPNFYKSPESLYGDHMDPDIDENRIEEINEFFMDIGDYEEIFEDCKEMDEYPIIRYLIYIVRADWDEVEKFKAETVGKYLDEIEIPISDVEEDYLEEL